VIKMKRARILLLFAAFAVYTGLCGAQDADLSGTWVGSTAVPDQAERDQITLVLKKEGNAYSGVISDSLALILQAPLRDVKFTNGTLTFTFTANADEHEVRVVTTLKYTGEKLAGAWIADDGDTGVFDLERKK
jgi:hypothetical protein